jgi:protein-S-isoprenylcysteine O-methyltransferase Ste14
MGARNDAAAVRSRSLKKTAIPHWLGPTLFAAGFWLLHITVPQHLSLVSRRYGWAGGRPGIWNLPRLICVMAGIAWLAWATFAHFVNAPGGWEWERTPKYLVRRAPYTFARNLMYLAELAVWLGWAVFFGSLAILLGFLVAGLVFQIIVIPWEERTLQARLGVSYVEYRNTVPRWLGFRSL